MKRIGKWHVTENGEFRFAYQREAGVGTFMAARDRLSGDLYVTTLAMDDATWDAFIGERNYPADAIRIVDVTPTLPAEMVCLLMNLTAEKSGAK